MAVSSYNPGSHSSSIHNLKQDQCHQPTGSVMTAVNFELDSVTALSQKKPRIRRLPLIMHQCESNDIG